MTPYDLIKALQQNDKDKGRFEMMEDLDVDRKTALAAGRQLILSGRPYGVGSGGEFANAPDDLRHRIYRDALMALGGGESELTHDYVSALPELDQQHATVVDLKERAQEIVPPEGFSPVYCFREGSGLLVIVKERIRQLVELGYDNVHDDDHEGSELLRAALYYIVEADPHALYPFGGDFEELDYEDRISSLSKAGALLAAEIDRLRREYEGDYEHD